MYEINCLDSDGNTINNFFQWDVDQKVIFELSGIENIGAFIDPEVHFSNIKRSDSLVTRSVSETADDTTKIISEVPNLLLQEPYPLLVYVYLTDADSITSQRTILYSEVPVRKRNKPNDYMYVENITRITAENIKDEIAASTLAVKIAAEKDIQDTCTAAKKSVDETKKDFEDTCKQIVKDAQTIKNETLIIKNSTQTESDNTQKKIEDEMKALLYENGIELNVYNIEGDVTLTFTINQTSAGA